jgi:hypothetical protein
MIEEVSPDLLMNAGISVDRPVDQVWVHRIPIRTAFESRRSALNFDDTDWI